MFRKMTYFYHGTQEYQRIQLKIIDVITSRLLIIFPEISDPEILNFWKIYNPNHSITDTSLSETAETQSDTIRVIKIRGLSGVDLERSHKD